MNRYEIFGTDEFIKNLRKVNPRQRDNIQRKLHDYICLQLREEPYFGHNIKKLVGYKPETWRYRIGKFRIFYLVSEEEKMNYMLTIEQRKQAY